MVNMTRKIIILFAICLLVVIGLGDACDASITVEQRIAITALYNSTNGDGWVNNSGWKSAPLDTDGFALPGTECGWYGVTCDGSESVIIELLLHSNQLHHFDPAPYSGQRIVPLLLLLEQAPFLGWEIIPVS